MLTSTSIISTSASSSEHYTLRSIDSGLSTLRPAGRRMTLFPSLSHTPLNVCTLVPFWREFDLIASREIDFETLSLDPNLLLIRPSATA